jgi:hypothetical protein
MRVPLPRAQRRRFRPLPLPFWLRLASICIGWLLIVIGIVGLFLPVLQGGISLALGLALLSISSQWVHLKLRGLMGRWPGIWRRMERLRRKLHGWLDRNAGTVPPAAGE